MKIIVKPLTMEGTPSATYPPYEIEIVGDEMEGFLKTAETFMRRFMTGQYPPVRLGR